MFYRFITNFIQSITGTCSCGATFQGTTDPLGEKCGPCYRESQ